MYRLPVWLPKKGSINVLLRNTASGMRHGALPECMLCLHLKGVTYMQVFWRWYGH